MTRQEFIRLEADAIKVISDKDPSIIWEAVACGAMEHVRLFAESQNYNVTLNDIVQIVWIDICFTKQSTQQRQLA